MFAAKGIDPATLATWDGMRAVAQKFKDAGIAPLALGNSEGWTGNHLFNHLLLRLVGPQECVNLALQAFDASAKPAGTRDPKLFLFDEPLSNLDAALRVATRIEIAGLKARMPDATMIYVTHDQVEAMTLAIRIVVLNAARIEQVGTPLDLYHTPANRFVAGFIGSPAMNFVDVIADAAGVKSANGDVVLSPRAGATRLGVPPEDLTLHSSDPDLLHRQVSIIKNLGELLMAYVDVNAPQPLIVKLPGSSQVKAGDQIALSADAARLHLFDAAGFRLG